MSEFVAEWSPRIGEEASRLQVRASRLLLLGGAASAGWIVTQVVGTALRSGAAQGIAVGLLAAAVALFAAGTYVVNRSFREMTRFLGVKVQFLQGPRLHPDSFRHWCEHHGVDAQRCS